MDRGPAAQFEWVNTSVSNPNISQDLVIRTKIRKQAMKKAAITRRANGNYGKHNFRQLPVFEPSMNEMTAGVKFLQSELPVKSLSNVADFDTVDGSTRPQNARNLLAKKRIMPGSQISSLGTMPTDFLSSVGYKTAKTKFGFDILDLSALTTFHVGRATLSSMNSDSAHVIRRFQPIQWFFFSHVPSLYEENTCLKLATDCLLSRVCQILSPESGHWKAKVISNYLKALKSLQSAIDSPSELYKPEVLCATGILALYELLDPAGKSAWIRHAAGVARLVQVRGPKKFRTEFEKSLFMSHVGPIIDECLLNNERCFLEHESWKAVLRSIIKHGPVLSERSEIVIELLIFKSYIPGIFRDITDWVRDTPKENTPSLEELSNQMLELRAGLLKWRTHHQEFIDTPKTSVTPAIFDKRSRIFSKYLACQILVCRLMASISFDRASLEKEIQAMVDLLLNIEPEVKCVNEDADMLYLAQVIGFAHASKATTQKWAEMSEREIERGLVDRGKFESWCRLCGRNR